jgi:hypothetical protein
VSLARVRPAEWAAGLAGAVLLVALFLPWYGTLAAWDAFDVIGVLLALLALPGPALLVAQAVRQTPAMGAALAIIGVLTGFVATILVAIRLIWPAANGALGAGAWLGLAGAVGLAAAAWWSMGTEVVPDMPAPDVEVRPAPPAGD